MYETKPYFYGTGRRKDSVARVRVYTGTGKVTILKAGSTVITATAAETADYEQATATCTLTVEKKPITIPTADATVFTYNGTEQTYALAEDGAYTITGNKQTNANETGYAVTVALKDTANTQWADGTTANKTYTFVIGKAVITVKAKDQTAYVGDKAPTLGEDSYTVSGLVGEEKLTTQPTVKYVGADGKEITPDMTKTGEVKILAGGAAASDNYTIRYEDGKLTVSTRPSGGGGGSRPATHPVQTEVSKDPDGSVSLSKTSAAKGDKVTITPDPDSGYGVDEVIVTDRNGREIDVTANRDGTYTFEQPRGRVTIEVTFTRTGESAFFTDVPETFWAYDEIAWAYDNGYVNGTTATTFSPNGSITRQQVWMILARLSGQSPANMAEARTWAMDNGISDGTNPEAPVTREQLAAMLYRYAALKGRDLTAGENLNFTDASDVSAYALPALQWATGEKILTGSNGALNPQAPATRAHLAAILHRYFG